MLKLLIVEDNIIFVKNLINNIIGENRNIKLVGIATDGMEALKMVKTYHPDIIILDIQIPKINGLEILEMISTKKTYQIPYIIVITGTIENISSIKNKEYIHSFYTKPIDCNVLSNTINAINDCNEENKIKSFIYKELDTYNFKQSSIAYRYLENAIHMSIKDPIILKNMEKDLFSKISKKYNTKPINIKWSIEKLIQTSYKYTKEDMSTKSFITNLVNKYKKIG